MHVEVQHQYTSPSNHMHLKRDFGEDDDDDDEDADDQGYCHERW